MVDNSTTLFIASKTNIHFQSLLELKKQKLKKPKKKEEQGQEDRKCPNCMKPFEHLLKHIGKSSCRGKVDEKFIQDSTRKVGLDHQVSTLDSLVSRLDNQESTLDYQVSKGETLNKRNQEK